eukprot:5023794-Ditylum_brightwellii.AAC.1
MAVLKVKSTSSKKKSWDKIQTIFQQLQEKEMYHQFKLILGQSRVVQAESTTMTKIKSLRDTSLHLSSPTIKPRMNNF